MPRASASAKSRKCWIIPATAAHFDFDTAIAEFEPTTHNTIKLKLGKTDTPNAAIWTQNGSAYCYSSDNKVVTVSADGVVTAVGKGTARIVAYYEAYVSGYGDMEVSDYCEVTVDYEETSGKITDIILGDFSGDISGGGNIVIKAFELVYNELFLGLEKTLITEMVMKEYGFTRREELLGLIEKIEGENGDDYIRTMVSFFFAAAKQGDKPALEYCERMAERGARLIAALSKELNFGGDEVEVVLSGSINVKLDNKAYLDMLLEKAEKYSGKKLKFIKLTQPPVTGCVNWIMQDFAN